MNVDKFETKGELERSIDRRTADLKRFLIDENFDAFEQSCMLKENDRLKRIKLIKFDMYKEK